MKGEPKTVRAVLLERHVVPEWATLFGRALWADTQRVDMKCWAAEGSSVPAGLRTRSRTVTGIRDPMLAQEWAFKVWDEYVADVDAALGGA